MCQILVFRLLFYGLRVLFLPFGLYMGFRGSEIIVDWEIIVLSGVPVRFSVVVDYMSVMFSFAVFFISGNVYWFAGGYMHGEEYMKRFGLLVFFFVVSMRILIFSGNLISVLLG